MAPGWWHKRDSKVLGYDNRVNELIDFPVRWMGPAHRIYFHTVPEAMAIGYLVDGARGALGGFSHLNWDGMLTPYDIMMFNNAYLACLDIEATWQVLDLEVQKLKRRKIEGISIDEMIDSVSIKPWRVVERIDVRSTQPRFEENRLFWDSLIKFTALSLR